MKPDDPPTPAEEPTVDVPNGSEPEVTAEHAHGSPPSTHEGHDAAPGMTRFGGYTIIGVLGEGGMGLVYRARQDRPQREVALKVIRPGW